MKKLLFLLGGTIFGVFTLCAQTSKTADLKIDLESKASRYRISLAESSQKVVICQLEVGQSYSVRAVKAEESDCMLNLLDDQKATAKDPALQLFTAKSTCQEFTLTSDCSLPLQGHLSIRTQDKSPESMAKMMGIAVSSNPNATYLVQDVFIGGGCFDVLGATRSGGAAQVGTFSNGANSINIDEGVIISTGSVNNAVGPNVSPSATTGYGSTFGDADLADIGGGATLYDVAAIEFDFTPTVNQVSFQYVFASEEYCEYVNSQFNDVFGFFISGPGIAGPYTNGAENIAVIPGSGAGVSINNVNHLSNTQLYVNNIPLSQGQGCNSAEGEAVDEIEYDGFTKVFTAVANVIPCQTYHIKLVIGDRGDDAYDSAVFLAANSFSAGSTATVSVDADVGPGPESAYEGCSDGYFVFTRVGGDLNDPFPIPFTISSASTATMGADYAPIPSQVVIPPGQSTYTLWIDVIPDLIPEGSEFIILELQNACSCTNNSVMLEIAEPPPLQIDMPDVFACEGQPTTLTPQVSGGIPGYSYQWSNGDQNPSITVVPEGVSSYSLVVSDDCGQTTALGFNVFANSPSAQLSGEGAICQGNFNASLQVDFEGFGPFELTYQVDGFFETITGIYGTPFNLPVSLPGTYTLVSVSSNGCPGEVDGFGEVTISEVLVAADTIPISCFGEQDGQIDLNVSGGTLPYSYNWNQGLPDVEDQADLEAGTYSVTVTDSLGCIGSASFPITEPIALEATISNVENIDCTNPGDGSIAINAAGGSGSYTYLWSTGNTEAELDGLEAGTYAVTVTDDSGCSVESSAEIIDEILIPTAVALVEDTLNCVVGELEIDGSASSTGSQLNYQWSTTDGAIQSGAQDLSPVVTLPGTYQLVVFDSQNNCADTTTVEVLQDIMPPLADAGLPDTLTCTQTELALQADNSSVGPIFTYAWTTTNGNIITGSSSLHPTIDEPGTYELLVTNNQNLCTATASVIIAENTEVPLVNLAPPETINCYQPSIELTSPGSSTGLEFSYQWTTANGDISSPADQENITISTGGTYALMIENLMNGCTASQSIEVFQDTDAPTSDAGVDTELSCATSTANLLGDNSSVNGPYLYEWTTLDGQILADSTTITSVAGLPGLYTLTVIDTLNGCSAVSSVSVFENSNSPTIAAQNPALLTCAVTSVSLDGTGSDSGSNFDIQWSSLDGNLIQNATSLQAQVNDPGTYVLTITDLTNSCISAINVDVEQDILPPLAEAGPGATLNCFAPVYSLDGTASDQGLGFAFNWSTPDGQFATNGQSLSPEVNSAGLYILQITNASNGCISLDSVQILVDQEAPLVNAGPDQELNCNVQALNLLALNTDQGPEFQSEWNTLQGSPVPEDGNLNPLIDAPGLFELVVLNSDNGCSASDTVMVSQNIIPPVANAGPGNVLTCADSIIALNGSGSSQGSNYTYTWSTTDGNILSSSNLLDPLIDTPGSYQLIVQNTDNFCSDTSLVNILQDIEAPMVDAGPSFTLTCQDPEQHLEGQLSSSGSAFSYTWTTTDGNVLEGGNTLAPLVNSPGFYLLTIQNANNGCTASDQVQVLSSQDYPLIDAGPDGILNCEISSFTLQAGNSSSGQDFEVTWNTLEGIPQLADNDLSPVINQPGVFELFITNVNNGCISTDTVTVLQDITIPLADAGESDILTCTDTILSLNGDQSSQGGPFLYEWSTNDGQLLSGLSSLNPMVNAPGNYQLVVINQENQCRDTSLVQIFQNIEPPVAEAGPAATLTCQYPSLALNGAGTSVGPTFTYQWHTTGGNLSGDIEGLYPMVDAGGLYQLEVTNTENGCVTLDEVFISVDQDYPVAAAGPDQILNCLVEEVTLQGQNSSQGSEFTYLWQGDGSQSIDSPDQSNTTVSEPGTYLLTVVNVENQCISFDSVFIAIDTITPVAEAGPDGLLTCDQTSLELNGIGSSTGSEFTYTWTSLAGQPVGNPQSLNPSIQEGGFYQLVVENTVNGCIAQDLAEVLVDTLSPMVSIASPDILTCEITTIQLNGTAEGNHPLNYQWSTVDGLIDEEAQALNPTVSGAGVYTLQVTNTGNGCISFAETVVAIDTLAPIALAGADQILNCTLTSLQLDGTGSSTGQTLYQWSTPDGQIESGMNTLNPEITTPGVYTLLVTFEENGCTASDEVVIGIDVNAPIATITEPDQLTCAVNSVTLTGNSNGEDFTFSWEDNQGNVIGLDNPESIEVDQPGFYTLTVINPDNGCLTTTQTQVLQDIVAPVAEAGGELILTCVNTQDQLDGGSSSQGANFNYSWTTQDGQILSGQSGLSPTVNQAGLYLLTVFNQANGCSSQDLVTVIEETPQDADIFVTLPICYGNTGNIQIDAVSGGYGPYTYSIDGGEAFHLDGYFPNIDPGFYEVVVQDVNGCLYAELVDIPAPPELDVQVESQVKIRLGETYQIYTQINFPMTEIESIKWYPSEGLSCDDCPNPIASPEYTTSYKVQVRTNNGCVDEDIISLVVNREPDIYIPNAFSPGNHDGTNDLLVIYARNNLVKQVNSLMIFNRWGESVFEVYNFPPNDPRFGWDGTHRGQKLNTGVFVYWTEVELTDGSTVILKGDVTLMN